MNIERQLSVANTKENFNLICDYIEKDESRFKEVMILFFDNSKMVNQRVSWVVEYYYKRNPKPLIRYLPQLVEKLSSHPRPHDAFIRNTLRIFQIMEIPEDFEGEIYDLSYQYLTNHENATAIKAFAMTVAFNISLKYPELQEEIKLAIEDQLSFESAGFTNRGRKIITAIEQKKRKYD